MRVERARLSGRFKEMMRTGERIYLRKIVREARNAEIIDESEYKVWKTLIAIRNSIVHNNAVADSNAECSLDGLEIVMIKGDMMKGKLNFFIRLLGITIDLYHDLLCSCFSC